jgi:sensor domain CHASE-containing protein
MTDRLSQRSVQEKITMTLLAVMATLAVLSFIALQYTVAPAFDRLETEQARTNLVRSLRAIQNDLQNLSAITGDWALWDDAYDYVRGEYPAFEDSNLDRPTLENLNLGVLAVYDVNGDLIWGQGTDNNAPVDISALQIFEPGSKTAELLLTHLDPAGQTTGLVTTALGPMMISSYPVVRSNGSGPIAGTLIMGQHLDPGRMQELRERTEVQLAWHPVAQGSAEMSRYPAALDLGNADTIMHVTSNRKIVSSGLLLDLFDAPFAVLEVTTPRSISALGASTVNGALLFLAIAGITVSIVTGLLLRHIVVVPLEDLTRQITRIRKCGDLSQRLNSSRDDEIGSLAAQFNRLTEEVHDARMLLLDQSFKAGKADAAAEVMHNIRNAMTPLINGLERLAKPFKVANSLRIKQATEELKDAECPPDRRQKLLMYVQSAFAHIKTTHDNTLDNLHVARKQAGQVEAILADQEKHAKVSPIVEDFDLGNVIEEAMLVLPRNDDDDVVLRLQDELRQYRVRGHRVGVLQVLGNVMLNAYESIKRTESHAGSIDVSASTDTLSDIPVVRLTISDTGNGFDKEAEQRIFQRGYSSKKGHMTGLGLHWCANALASMGGGISAESNGPGQGANIHVLLPAAQGGQ